ncbi:hypothetical protein CTAYLR_004004 [Chrysophaeum taylorii]|uniref:Uncharacterized protein n=1 Tax=Chrysophaeum taylorii TaxID=2483200 RepID=A0AAD7U7P0_9STRA|nr:hypothetical protein CTAYLR_004004 [Chrysophaeum taylorii]
MLLLLFVGGVGGVDVGCRQRRVALASLVAAPVQAASVAEVGSPAEAPSAGRALVEVILPPVFNRATHRYEVGRGAYAFDQLLKFANVSASIRMNVLTLADGSLCAISPVAPTGECLRLLEPLGTIKHIVLPVNALEHKAFAGVFARRFPEALVWVAPGQYGPFGTLPKKMPYPVAGVLGEPSQTQNPLWPPDLQVKVFFVDLPQNAGPACEVALLHSPTSTLVVTDAVSWIPRTPPSIFASLFGRELETDLDFWPKSVLQAVFLKLRKEGDAWPAYDKITNRLVRAPILRAFSDARAPEETRAWVDDIARTWDFDRILTSHFSSPIAATPAEFRDAFSRLDDGPGDPRKIPVLDDSDWQPLDDLNDIIDNNNLAVSFDVARVLGRQPEWPSVPPSEECPVRRPRTLIYNRIPKCGSGSVAIFIALAQEKNGFQLCRSTMYTQRWLAPPDRKRYERNPFVASRCRKVINVSAPAVLNRHVFFYEFRNKNVLHVNMIREPVSRCVSRFYYERDARGAVGKGVTIDACIRGPCRFHEWTGREAAAGGAHTRFGQLREECSSNYLTRWFCGHGTACSADAGALATSLDKDRAAGMLSAAAHNLVRHHPAVGVVSRMRDSLALFAATIPSFFGGLDTAIFNTDRRHQPPSE